MKKALLPVLIAALLSVAMIVRGADVPFLSGRVNDNAEILSPGTRAAVTEQLKSHEDRTGNQIAVLTVPTIGDKSIEEYAAAVFSAWKLGKKGQRRSAHRCAESAAHADRGRVRSRRRIDRRRGRPDYPQRHDAPFQGGGLRRWR